jgi:alpha-1,3(6)-mannosylglycoprotein beta-1,6-N-acetyl-glucosaminyltransferase
MSSHLQISSQNPYAERFIGAPHVLTVSIENATELESAVRLALTSQVPSPPLISCLSQVTPYLPVEFTPEGMLQRVDALVQKQDLCSPVADWPPFSSAQFVHAERGASCQIACATKGESECPDGPVEPRDCRSRL